MPRSPLCDYSSKLTTRARRTTVAAILALCTAATIGCDRNDQPRQLGRTAPNFTVTDSQHTVSLASYRGHVVLLNFWASWCGPCLEELPSLEALHQQMPDVQILGVSIDTDTEAYQQFLTLHHVDFLTVVDPAQQSNALYGTYRPPETYIIDKQGVIRRKFIGPQDWTSPEIVSMLRRLTAS
jgi:peroxiredoxin